LVEPRWGRWAGVDLWMGPLRTAAVGPAWHSPKMSWIVVWWLLVQGFRRCFAFGFSGILVNLSCLLLYRMTASACGYRRMAKMVLVNMVPKLVVLFVQDDL